MTEPMDFESWRRAAQQGRAPATVLRKETSVIGKAAGDRRISFTFSTGAVDRMNDTIDPSGWDLRNYRRNNTVLYGHDHTSLPIGRAYPRKEAGALRGEIEFPPPGVYPFADQVHDLVAAGYLSATSVGFLPKKWVYNETRNGFDFLEQELLEISVVPVPALQEAVIDGRAHVAAVQKWLGHARAEDEEDVLWVRDAPAGDEIVVLIEEDDQNDYIVLDTTAGPRMLTRADLEEIIRWQVAAIAPAIRTAAEARLRRRGSRA